MSLLSREYIASYNSGVIAVRLQASEKASLSADLSLSRDVGVIELVADTDTNTVTMDVGGDDADSVPFFSAFRVVTDGGKSHWAYDASYSDSCCKKPAQMAEC